MKRRNTVRWKPIPDTKDEYWVSSNGKVQSRRFGRVLLLKQMKIGDTKETNPYMSVNIYIDKISTPCLVHRLVGLLFVENPHDYPEINHKDGIRWNNYYKNLEWCTRSMNIIHSYEVLGRVSNLKGKVFLNNRGAATLDEEQVERVLSSNRSIKELALQFCVTAQTIRRIKKKKTWKIKK